MQSLLKKKCVARKLLLSGSILLLLPFGHPVLSDTTAPASENGASITDKTSTAPLGEDSTTQDSEKDGQDLEDTTETAQLELAQRTREPNVRPEWTKPSWDNSPDGCEEGFLCFAGVVEIAAGDSTSDAVEPTDADRKGAELKAMASFSSYVKTNIESELKKITVCSNREGEEEKKCISEISKSLIARTDMKLSGAEYKVVDEYGDGSHYWVKIRVRQTVADRRLQEARSRWASYSNREDRYTPTIDESDLQRELKPEDFESVDGDCFQKGVFDRSNQEGIREFRQDDITDVQASPFPTCHPDRRESEKEYFGMEKVEPFVEKEGRIVKLTHWQCIDSGDKEKLFERKAAPKLGDEANQRKWMPKKIEKGNLYETKIRSVKTQNGISWITKANRYRDNAYFRLQCLKQLKLQHSRLINTLQSERTLLNNYVYERGVVENEIKLKKERLDQIGEDLERYRDNLSTYLVVHVEHAKYLSNFGMIGEPVEETLTQLGKSFVESVTTMEGTGSSSETKLRRITKPSIEYVRRGPGITAEGKDIWHYLLYVSFKPVLSGPVNRKISRGNSNIDVYIYSDKNKAKHHFSKYGFFSSPQTDEDTEFSKIIKDYLDEMEKTNGRIGNTLKDFEQSIGAQKQDLEAEGKKLENKKESLEADIEKKDLLVHWTDRKIESIQKTYWRPMVDTFVGINRDYQTHLRDRYFTYFHRGAAAEDQTTSPIDWAKEAFGDAFGSIEKNFVEMEFTEKMTIFGSEVIDSSTKTINYQKTPIAFQIVYFNFNRISKVVSAGINALYHLQDSEDSMTGSPEIELCNRGNRKRDEECYVREDEQGKDRTIAVLQARIEALKRVLTKACPDQNLNNEAGEKAGISKEEADISQLKEIVRKLEEEYAKCAVEIVKESIQGKGDQYQECQGEGYPIPSRGDSLPKRELFRKLLEDERQIDSDLTKCRKSAKAKEALEKRQERQAKLRDEITEINGKLGQLEACKGTEPDDLTYPPNPTVEQILAVEKKKEALATHLNKCGEETVGLKMDLFYDVEAKELKACSGEDSLKIIIDYPDEAPFHEKLKIIEDKTSKLREVKKKCFEKLEARKKDLRNCTCQNLNDVTNVKTVTAKLGTCRNTYWLECTEEEGVYLGREEDPTNRKLWIILREPKTFKDSMNDYKNGKKKQGWKIPNSKMLLRFVKAVRLERRDWLPKTIWSGERRKKKVIVVQKEKGILGLSSPKNKYGVVLYRRAEKPGDN